MTPRFLDLAEVLEIHQSRIEQYGGSNGVRDVGLLLSALAQPAAGLGGDYFHKDLWEMAAAYLFHLARNHAFVDGNKRTALACCLVFLAFNGIELEADPKALEDLTIATAEGKNEKVQVAEFLKNREKY
jgi:death-on-curing protein